MFSLALNQGSELDWQVTEKSKNVGFCTNLLNVTTETNERMAFGKKYSRNWTNAYSN